MTQAELMSFLNQNLKTNQNVPALTKLKNNITPPSQTRACGLFNPNMDEYEKFNDMFDEIDTSINNFHNNDKSNEEFDFLNLEDDKVEKMCQELLQDSPVEEKQSLEDCEFLEHLLLDPLPPSSTHSVPSTPQVVKDNVMLDHGYSSNKRIYSLDTDDDSCFTQDSIYTESMTITTPSTVSSSNKKKRCRGIYRAEDIKNEDDLANYLERRKKNNQSSKASRATKRSYYSSMDAKSEYLKEQNDKLEEKANLLEQLNKLIKEHLIEQFKK